MLSRSSQGRQFQAFARQPAWLENGKLRDYQLQGLNWLARRSVPVLPFFFFFSSPKKMAPAHALPCPLFPGWLSWCVGVGVCVFVHVCVLVGGWVWVCADTRGLQLVQKEQRHPGR